MKIEKLSHVCLGTHDLSGQIDFYCVVLGFELAHEYRNQNDERFGAFLHVGGGTFIELFNDQDAPIEGGLYRHFCLHVDDLKAVADHLLERGIVLEIRRGRSDGTLLAEFSDPEGNVIEFHQYDDHSALLQYIGEVK